MCLPTQPVPAQALKAAADSLRMDVDQDVVVLELDGDRLEGSGCGAADAGAGRDLELAAVPWARHDPIDDEPLPDRPALVRADVRVGVDLLASAEEGELVVADPGDTARVLGELGPGGDPADGARFPRARTSRSPVAAKAATMASGTTIP